MAEANFYAGVPLDRAALLRRDGRALAQRAQDPGSRFLPLWQGRNLIREAEAPKAAFLSGGVLDGLAGEVPQAIFLGLAQDIAHFAVDLSALSEDAARALEPDARFEDLRRVGALMAQAEGALLAYARGIVHWHRRHRFCGVCGSQTESREGGHLRMCANAACRAPHFPRTDPAVIMLVTFGERCLLGRHGDWAPGLYSTLAGFVEPGESLEEAVSREVAEEAGVEVVKVRYHSSQPWPFPASLMLGFIGEAVSESLTLDPHELEDAQWFTREQLAQAKDWFPGSDLAEAGDGCFRLPNRDSISRRLVDDWRLGKTGR
ncbi:MAG: NAD(+) diphosphatase [Proteobacteria bacterium]|nr:NAD(+) diphosphatase [Pseudomonadota bacterium]